VNSNNISGWDPVWEEIYRREEWGKYPPEYVIRFVARNFYHVADRRRVRLLDLGCGPGACTWFMAREGFDVSGIDGSPTAIDRARKRLTNENLSADMRVGDYTTLPWNGEQFEGAVDCATLCHNTWQAARRTVSEVHRVLKPGGVFISSGFTDRTWGFGTGPCVEPGGFSHLSEGPMVGKGFSRFLPRTQIESLYEPLELVNVELISQTVENMSRLIEMWIVTCRKAPSL